MSTEIVKRGESFVVEVNGAAVADIIGISGAEDSFARLSDNAFSTPDKNTVLPLCPGRR